MGDEWRPVHRNASSTLDYPSNPGNGTNGHSASDPVVHATPRWHQPASASVSPSPSPRDKVFVSSQEVRQMIAGSLGSRLAEDFRLFLGDNQYYLPPLEDAQEVIQNSGLSRATYMPESFDCDDFAMVLKAHFCEAAYKDFQRRPPHCFGLIWGELPHVHAVNWMITDDGRLRLIEPQTGEVFEPRHDTRNITFMLA